jgi:murein tripeptide amidase MpaA
LDKTVEVLDENGHLDMRSIYVTDNFDGGSIESFDISDPKNIQLKLKEENQSKFKHWFYFRLEGDIGQALKINIINAGESAFKRAWSGYKICFSWDGVDWLRLPTEYQDGVLKFECELKFNSVYFAYFAPYSYSQHMSLLSSSQTDPRVQLETLGSTHNGNSISLLKVSRSFKKTNRKVWLIARQHAGETMAEWFAEGFISALLSSTDAIESNLLDTTTFYISPNMNPDGAILGNLRCNALGVDLNREWQSPSIERSPEVFLVRKKMLDEGVNLFLDVHGDEAMPYVFLVGCSGIPAYNEDHAQLESIFKKKFLEASPEFQDRYGYYPAKPGKANLNIATNWVGQTFKALSFTLEMPFKDNANSVNPETGWSPQRCLKLGADVLFPITKVLEKMPRPQE